MPHCEFAAGPEPRQFAGAMSLNAVGDIGWCACGLMLITFCCKRVIWLRSFAVAANLAFIAYGWFGDIAPVMTLHVVLLPINLMRLAQVLQDRNRQRKLTPPN